MATVEMAAPAGKSGEREGSFSLLRFWKSDLLAGFLVFLIALPLCLGISIASGAPAIAGVFTAIVGGIVATFVSNSELTIKGPAAGMIVIVLGAGQAFGWTGKDPAADFHAYQCMLAVGVAAGIIQILFALFRTGVLGEFFPTATVHGLLSAIGVIIISKQVHVALGVKAPSAGPLQSLAAIPNSIANMNPDIAIIGGLSLLILFGMPLIKNRLVKRIPAQMVVVLMAIPLGLYFGLEKEHVYSFHGSEYRLGPNFLVDVPMNLFGAITHPDFSALTTGKGWYWVMMFSLIGSLESMLSAKAVDLIDPQRRKTSMDRDLLAVGIGNTLVALIGGLPMISEIVRSRANIDSGAQSRWANCFHGLFLLFFLALLPGLIHEIPLAALGAMLVYTGFRLASPKEFMHMYHIGPEQFIIFCSTLVGVLATDLLKGIFIGIGVKIALHLWNGAPLSSLVLPKLAVADAGDGNVTISVRDSAVFSSWIPLRKKIVQHENAKEMVVDLSETRMVDHTVMAKLTEMQKEFAARDCRLVIAGLDGHRSLSDHPLAARTKARTPK